MLRSQVTIASADGLHARPANDFAKLAASLPGKVMVSRPGGNKVRGDSILLLMTLGLRGGESVVVEIDDDTQETLLESLINLLQLA
jgi:phosphocarrier protein HPr